MWSRVSAETWPIRGGSSHLACLGSSSHRIASAAQRSPLQGGDLSLQREDLSVYQENRCHSPLDPECPCDSSRVRDRLCARGPPTVERTSQPAGSGQVRFFQASETSRPFSVAPRCYCPVVSSAHWGPAASLLHLKGKFSVRLTEAEGSVSRALNTSSLSSWGELSYPGHPAAQPG